MSYTFMRNGVPEPVEKERWCWTATYTDGTSLQQFDDQGCFHQFKEIDQTRLHSFMMKADGQVPIVIFFYPGYKLIHFYRNARLHVGNPEEAFVHLYCFGYETPTDKVILMIMPNDELVVVRDANDVEITL